MVMPRSRASLVSLATLSTLGAATTWVALLSWRGFVELSGHFLGPLLLLGAVLVVSGTLARYWRAPGCRRRPRPGRVHGRRDVAGCSPGRRCPSGPRGTELLAVFGDAVDSANQYAPPVPEEAPGVDPVLIVGGLGCMLLVDFLACTLRRVPLAGLPLLTVFTVPLSILGTGPSWYVFALTAAGFMAMLFVHEDEQISRWGRALERDRGGADVDAFGVRTGAVRTNAAAIGGVVTALAIVVPARDPDPGRARLRLRAGVGRRRRHQHQQPDGRPAPRPDPGRGHRPGRGRHRRPGPVLPPDRACSTGSPHEAWSSGDRDVPSEQPGQRGRCRHSRAWTRRWSGRSSTTPSARPTASTRRGSRPRPRSAGSRPPATGATTWPPGTSWPATTTWTPPASSGSSPRSSSASTPPSSRWRPPRRGW